MLETIDLSFTVSYHLTSTTLFGYLLSRASISFHVSLPLTLSLTPSLIYYLVCISLTHVSVCQLSVLQSLLSPEDFPTTPTFPSTLRSCPPTVYSPAHLVSVLNQPAWGSPRLCPGSACVRLTPRICPGSACVRLTPRLFLSLSVSRSSSASAPLTTMGTKTRPSSCAWSPRSCTTNRTAPTASPARKPRWAIWCVWEGVDISSIAFQEFMNSLCEWWLVLDIYINMSPGGDCHGRLIAGLHTEGCFRWPWIPYLTWVSQLKIQFS